MRAIKMNEKEVKKLLAEFTKKFEKELDSFNFNMNESEFNVSIDLAKKAKDKITILYTQDAYLKMKMLVKHYNTEVSWYGLVEKVNDKLYRVYDVRICKQYVNGGKVDTEDEDTLDFFNSLTDDEVNHLHFQAHSHVNVDTTASPIDLGNQEDAIVNLGKTGFYIFQIWNKKNDINTYLYDLDNNTFYDKNDVVLSIETENSTLSDWVKSTESLINEKKITYYSTLPYAKNTKFSENYYGGGYWNGERWGW